MPSLIRKEIEGLLEFLEPLLGLANSHMVDFFTKSSYQTHLPVQIQTEIAQVGTKKCIECILGNDFKSTATLKQFAESSEKFTLSNTKLCSSLREFIADSGLDTETFKVEVFMNTKKSHEVEILSSVIASLCKVEEITHLIDIGDGKGYLSSMLALHYSIPTLGIDSSDVNTCGAVKRLTKLSRIWKGLKKSPRKSFPAKNDPKSSVNLDLYKQVTEFVSENSDLEHLLRENFPEKHLNVGLIGLHTCGNLAADSMKIFNANANIKLLCNVGCCYHLLEEGGQGFPLSSWLRARNLKIGRSARMIANQSVERMLSQNALPTKSIYYRALLEVLFAKYCPVVGAKHVGKYRTESPDFVDYCKRAQARVGVDFGLSDQQLSQFLFDYEAREDELNLFYLIRAKLAPVIECLIMLDRLLFLKENHWEHCGLVQFFDPVISPRCYGIVAIKR